MSHTCHSSYLSMLELTYNLHTQSVSREGD